MKKIVVTICLFGAALLNASNLSPIKRSVSSYQSSTPSAPTSRLIISSSSPAYIEPIEVTDDFEIFNGLPGMRRDMILHLINILKSRELYDSTEKRELDIQAILDIGQETAIWKKHKHFIEIMRNYDRLTMDQVACLRSRGANKTIDMLIEKGLYDEYDAVWRNRYSVMLRIEPRAWIKGLETLRTTLFCWKIRLEAFPYQLKAARTPYIQCYWGPDVRGIWSWISDPNYFRNVYNKWHEIQAQQADSLTDENLKKKLSISTVVAVDDDDVDDVDDYGYGD
ncbi:hypothetical protein FACS189472_00460 [Alphaproteobacteria bacterium]|nr:hypothetical protein FACS189472_00460 [Alphaproteobacteria bacterium]